MTGDADTNKRLSSKLDIPYPDVSKLPEAVRQKFDGLPTVVNIFRMCLANRSGAAPTPRRDRGPSNRL
jgi:hypothetical protein